MLSAGIEGLREAYPINGAQEKLCGINATLRSACVPTRPTGAVFRTSDKCSTPCVLRHHHIIVAGPLQGAVYYGQGRSTQSSPIHAVVGTMARPGVSLLDSNPLRSEFGTDLFRRLLVGH